MKRSLSLMMSLWTLLLLTHSSVSGQVVDKEKNRLLWQDVTIDDPVVRAGILAISTSSKGGMQEVAPVLKNNFTDTVFVKIKYSIHDNCGNVKEYTVERTLKAWEEYNPGTWWGGWQFSTGCTKVKEYEKDLKSIISHVSGQTLIFRNLTNERKAAREKKWEEERQAAAKKAADEKKKEQDRIAAEEKKKAAEKKKEEERIAAEKKKEEEKKVAEKKAADKKKEEEAKAKAPATKTDAKSSLAGSSSTTTTSRQTESAAESKQAKEEAKRQAAEEAKALQQQRAEEQRRLEEERRQKEAEERRAKQAAYDDWKAKKQQERTANETASAAASFGLLTLFGQWIYNDKMGEVNPDYVFRTDKKAAQFNIGIEYGYSASVYPMIFKSSYSTMINGEEVYEKSLEKVSAFTVNLDTKIRIGAENEQYGGYAYFNPKLGFSPIFNAYNASPFVFGGKVYGGIKWVKGYIDYSLGSRTFTKTSNDPEEAGEGKSSFKFNKLEYGIRFTTKPDADYKRSHIGIGIITETLKSNGTGGSAAYAHPETNYLSSATLKTPAITGYAFEWKKDHHFKLFANVYPKYIYAGETDHPGSPSKEFNAKTTGAFVELGFVRSVDWFFNY
jgi:hypothetical protein